MYAVLAGYTAVTLAVAVAVLVFRCGLGRDLGPLQDVLSLEAGNPVAWTLAKCLPAFVVTLLAPQHAGLALLRATLFEATLTTSRRCRITDPRALREFAAGLGATTAAIALAVYIRA